MPDPDGKAGNATAHLKRILVSNVIDFVFGHLDGWRDSNRKDCTAESELNEQLCVYLSYKARSEGLFLFHHEQSQGRQRRIDIAAKPTGAAIFACGYESMYDNITVLEAKRLPAPTKARKDEYVTGCTETSGGIQRFRLCLHGQEHDTAGMIGYIQKDGVESAHRHINNSFARITGCTDGLEWAREDSLKPLEVDRSCGKARTESVHSRCDGTIIRLHHLWIEMNHRPPS